MVHKLHTPSRFHYTLRCFYIHYSIPFFIVITYKYLAARRSVVLLLRDFNAQRELLNNRVYYNGSRRPSGF